MRVQMFVVAWSLSLLMFFFYVATGWLTDVRKAIVAKQEAKVLEVLSVLLFENDEEAKQVHNKASALPTPALLRVIQTLAVDLDGQARARLQQLVRTNGLEKSIRRRATARRWRMRVQAAQLQYLVTHPDHDRSKLLNDKHSLVRARAAESLTPNQAAAHVEELLELLDDEAIVVRIAAQDAVLTAGSRAVPALLERLERGEANALQALQVAANLPDARLTSALDDYARSDDIERRRLSAQALGHGGGTATAQILERLAVDDDAEVRVAAIKSLAVTRSQRSAAVVGRALRDRSWLVRRAAGLALDDLGAPGHMLLRRHLHDDDPFARDMARQILDSIAARTGLSIVPALDNPLDLADSGLIEPSDTAADPDGSNDPADEATAARELVANDRDAQIALAQSEAAAVAANPESAVASSAASIALTIESPVAPDEERSAVTIESPLPDVDSPDPVEVSVPTVEQPSTQAPRVEVSAVPVADVQKPLVQNTAAGQPSIREAQAQPDHAQFTQAQAPQAQASQAQAGGAPSASMLVVAEREEVELDLRLDDAFLEALLGPAPDEDDS